VQTVAAEIRHKQTLAAIRRIAQKQRVKHAKEQAEAQVQRDDLRKQLLLLLAAVSTAACVTSRSTCLAVLLTLVLAEGRR
jgi:hypothetical protein